MQKDNRIMLGACKICGNRTEDSVESYLYDDRFGYPGLFKLIKCNSCGHKFLEGEFKPEMLVALYSNYDRRSEFDIENYQPYKEIGRFKAWLDGEYSFAFRWVPKNVRVLDIGCGLGETLGYHKARGCDVYGVEADANIRRVADRFGFKVHVGLFDPGLYEEKFFDYVTMDQVVEHTTDPIEVLKGLEKVLKPGGYAVLSMPNSNGWGAWVFGKKWISWHTPYHIQHFSPESMRIAAEKAGMKFEECKIITSSEWLNYQWLHLLTYPKEGEPSTFWAAHGKLTRIQALIYRFIYLFKKTRINSLITRLFDGLNLGDNFIFILRKPA